MGNWQRIIELEEIPQQGSRVVKTGKGNIALFRTADDQVFALHDKCPHKGGPLSQGIVFEHTVVCPLHSWKVNLENGEAIAPDVGCARKLNTRLEAGVVFLQVDNVM